MRRRTFFRVGGAALAGTALLLPAAAAEQALPGSDVVNVKDRQFGAAGDSRTDDTAAIQAAVDHCFGSPSAPHGSAAVHTNSVLYFPPGTYCVSAPIEFTKLAGARIIGSGRFVTKIINESRGPTFVTNGCGYSHFEGLYLRATDITAAVFDLNFDGTPGGPALQSNTFVDIFFHGGACGVEIGAGNYMGSENIFFNCFWILCGVAGLKTSNFNALQNTVVGGNFQTCNIGIWVYRGSVNVIESVGFQQQEECDIRVDNSADDTINIVGCRSESTNFVRLNNFVHGMVAGCSHASPTSTGCFLQPGGCPTTVERSVSVNGQISLAREARLSVRGCSFGRKDWLSYGPLHTGQTIELEDVQYGGTPNRHPNGPPVRIARQRITAEGVFEYALNRL